MTSRDELPRRMGLATATALVVGGTFGIGVFVTTADMAQALASPALLLAVWLFTGAMALCGALCFGELAARHPQAGGSYVYLRQAFGQGVAFLYGWKCLLVMDPGLTATLATSFGTHAHVVAPFLPAKGAAIAAILVIAVANIAGLGLAAGIGRLLAVVKVGLVLVLVVRGFAYDGGVAAGPTPFFARAAGAPPLVPALAGAAVAAFFAFGGWWDTSKLAGEMRDPQRSLPRALAMGVLVVLVLYVAVSAVFLHVVPLASAGSADAFTVVMGEALFGARGARVFAGIITLALSSSMFAVMTMAPRVYYAMARDEVMPAFVGGLDPRTGTPVRAIAIQALMAVILVALGTFDSLLVYFVSVSVAFLGLTVAALFRLRARPTESGYRTPLFPLTPVVFLVSTTLVFVLLVAGRPREAVLGVAVVALGIPVYRFVVVRKPRG